MQKIIYTLNELIVKALSLFQANETLQVLYAVEDGQFFYEENRAELHAKNKKMKVFTIHREVEISAYLKKTETKALKTKEPKKDNPKEPKTSTTQKEVKTEVEDEKGNQKKTK